MPVGEQVPRTYDLIYHETYTPAGCLTEAGWLRAGFRVVGEKATQLLVLHDRPHGRRRSPEEPFPPEEVAALRLRLQQSEYPSDEDRRLLVRMDVAAQVSWANLYPPEAVEPITTPTQSEAWDLLSGLWWCGSHRDEFIFGGYKEGGEKYVYTAGRTIFKSWDILDHKKGECFLGVKRGEHTRIIDIDLDRHTAAVSSGHHLKTVLDTLRFLQETMPWASPHVTNINPRNGSCHVTMYLPRAIPVWQARLVVADIRSGCPWLRGVEIYPDNQCQFLLPLRQDKVTVIDRVLLPSVKAWRKVEIPGQKRKKGRRPQKVRREYMAMDAAAYWAWINDEERKPCDPALVEAELRKAYKPMPDMAGMTKAARDGGSKPSAAGMAPIGRMRGRLSRELVAFWLGKGER